MFVLPQNIFVNSGIRTIAETGLLTSSMLEHIGYSIGHYMRHHYQLSRVVIGKDTRASGSIIKKHLMIGLHAAGITMLDAGIVPTPWISHALQQEYLDSFGISITASHNPAEYNGIKILMKEGYLTIDDERSISTICVHQQDKIYDDSVPVLSEIDLFPSYVTSIAQYIGHKKIALDIVLDMAHGATSFHASRIFRSYGFNVVPLHESTDGTLINHHSGSVHPKVMIDYMKSHNISWGCAFDGDGDRIIVAHESGYMFDGDDMMAILLQHQLFRKEDKVVSTIMSNVGIEHYLKDRKKELLRTDVGERNIIHVLRKNNALLGTEPCGHITLLFHTPCSDGILSALLFFDTIADQIELLVPSYKKYAQVHANIDLTKWPISRERITEAMNQWTMILFPGRLVIRLSNTEPVLRIMIEHEKKSYAEDMMTKIIAYMTYQKFELKDVHDIQNSY